MEGPSNRETFLNTIPSYWESMRKQWDQRVGMIPRYEGGPKAGQPKDEADWTKTERARIEFPRSNEGHGFVRPENILDFARHLEKFLSEVLGGRYEEWQ